MPLRYRDNMTDAEAAAFWAEVQQLDQAHADAAACDAANGEEFVDDEERELFDPVRDGWVGKDGRP